MIFQHHRVQIWNRTQHPYIHPATDIAYTHPSLPVGSVVNLQQALDWAFAVIYPQTKAAVATIADLPLIGNVLNDYRVVLDNGAGKSQGYRWEQREGEAAPTWHLISEIDWGADSVLQEWQQRTQDQFVMRYGYDSLDNTGAAVVGVLAGQVVYGGRSAATNLTFYPNAGDGAGAVSGFVQTAATFRPAVATNTIDIGTVAAKFRTGYFGTSVLAGTMTLSGGTVADSSGSVSFGALNLSTTGTLNAGATTATSFITGTTTFTARSINDSTPGATFSFNAMAISTTGLVTANAVSAVGAASTFKTGTQIGNLTLGNGSIVDSGGAISFGANDLTTTGKVTASTAQLGGVTFAGTTLNTTAGNLVLNAASGVVQVATASLTFSAATGTSVTLGGTVFNVNGISTASTVLTLDGSSIVVTGSDLSPFTDASESLGKTNKRFTNLYLSSSIGDGTTTIANSVLQSLRAINTGVAAGNSIFWSGTQWLPADPDTEVFHDALQHLTLGAGASTVDAGHTQFVVLTGRAGGQTVQGGTLASQNLTLDSTANATKGFIILTSVMKPNADNTLDLGAVGARYQNLYIGGQGIGLRLENAANVAGLPAASAGTKGRVAFETTLNNVYVDIGGTWQKLGADVYENIDAASWAGGATTTHTYDVSATFADARRATWQFQENASNRQIMQGALIEFPTATSVKVSFDNALAAGTYTLVGVG